MRPLIAPTALLALSLVAAGSAARAADADEAIRAATRVVMAQLDAFRRDDFTTAYGFASPMIQQIFDRERFEAMVRGGYPEIARSASAVVSRAELAPDDTVYLTLRIQGANGHTVEATYELVREAGTWRINGVVTRAAPGIVMDGKPSLNGPGACAASSRGMPSAVAVTRGLSHGWWRPCSR